MPSFAVSIAILSLLQAALVALPRRSRPQVGRSRCEARGGRRYRRLDRRRDRGGRDNAGVGEGPHLARPARRAAAGGVRPRLARSGARGPPGPARRVPLFALAWRAQGSLAGEASPPRPSGARPASRSAGCSSPPSPAPGCAGASTRWPTIDALRQRRNPAGPQRRPQSPPPRPDAAAPAGGPVRRRPMGFGDVFVAATVGLPAGADRRRQLIAAVLAAVLGLGLRPALLRRRHPAGTVPSRSRSPWSPRHGRSAAQIPASRVIA